MCEHVLVRRVLAVLTTVVIAAGCGVSTAPADGPRKQICDQTVGRANELSGSGPFYVDAAGTTTQDVTASANSSPMWVQVSDSCAHGAQVSISEPSVIGINAAEIIKAGDKQDVAVPVVPQSPGRTTLTATVPGGAAHTVVFTIGPSAG